MDINEWFKSKDQDLGTLRRKKLRWEGLSAKLKSWAFIILIFGELILLLMLAKSYGLISGGVVYGEKIAVLDFNKEITSQYTKRVISALEKVREDRSYKALLFVMNSPGGSPSEAEELSQYIKDFNKSKPVYMYVQNIAASGGYYIASAIKPLRANPNAIVGSIGVILPHFAFEKLASTVGVQEDDLTAGRYKKPIRYIKKLFHISIKQLMNLTMSFIRKKV